MGNGRTGLGIVGVMLARPWVGWGSVALVGALAVLTVFAAVILNLASNDSGTVQVGHVPERGATFAFELPWQVWAGSVSWPGRPSSLVGVDLACVLVLGSTGSGGTVVYTSEKSGQRVTVVLPPAALVERSAWKTGCDWPQSSG